MDGKRGWGSVAAPCSLPEPFPRRARPCVDLSCTRTGLCHLSLLPLCHFCGSRACNCQRKPKDLCRVTDSCRGVVVLSGGGRDVAGEEGASWGLLCLLPGCHSAGVGELGSPDGSAAGGGGFVGTRDWMTRKGGSRGMLR